MKKRIAKDIFFGLLLMVWVATHPKVIWDALFSGM